MNAIINDVSDTALWVAHYRAVESQRPDALFNDPFATLLVGERGKKIAASMKHFSRQTAWTVVMRTCIIDRYIKDLIADGVDTFINLGAGLDTRPYRMNLPSTVRWIEVDYPHLLALKEAKLAQAQPTCQLERVKLDLADRPARRLLFSRTSAESRKVAILTEGVIPYLSENQVTELAEDMGAHPNFLFWIVEYIDPRVYPYLQRGVRARQLKNAPLQFFPADWLGFFQRLHWQHLEISYFSELSTAVGRPVPMPWLAHVFYFFMSKQRRKDAQKFSGFILFSKQ